MNIDLMQPSFTGTQQQQIEQMQTYIYQLREKLQWAFDTIGTGGSEGGTGGGTITQNYGGGSGGSSVQQQQQAQDTFNAIKAFIIGSADIVKAYADEIDEIFAKKSGYTASGKHGSYVEETKSRMTANSDGILLNSGKLEKLSAYGEGEAESANGGMQGYAIVKKSNGYMRLGFLGVSEDADDNGQKSDEYGLEIGLVTDYDENGQVSTTSQFSRYTNKRVVIYSNNGVPGATLTDDEMHTTTLIADKGFEIGNFMDVVEANGNVVTRWVET